MKAELKGIQKRTRNRVNENLIKALKKGRKMTKRKLNTKKQVKNK